MRGVEDGVDSAAAEGGGDGRPPVFQVIVLGAGGGPSEDNVTGLLVRSTATNWTKGSILAVDAGTHLAAIIRILEEHLPRATREKQAEPPRTVPSTETPLRSRPSLNRNGSSSRAISPYTSTFPGYFAPISESRGIRAGSPAPQGPESNHGKLILTSGPFTDLMVPYETPKANASYLLRNLISTFLITHPHLDHLSGFAINTASFQHTSRPKKLAALPSTIDAIKTHIFNDVIWPNLSDEEGGVGFVSYMRLIEGGNVALGDGEGRGYIEICDGLAVKAWSVSHGICLKPPHSHNPHGDRSHIQDAPTRRHSRNMSPSSINPRRRSSLAYSDPYLASPTHHHPDRACVYDSSAFFIRDDHTGHELLIFGDVEPDSISLFPRTARVWADAAPKIAAGILNAIFIECSYSDSQSDETLFGHLAPRHLIAELQVLANQVRLVRRGSTTSAGSAAAAAAAGDRGSMDDGKKRKRLSNGAAIARDEHDVLSWRKSQRRRHEPRMSISPSTRRSEDPEMSPPVPVPIRRKTTRSAAGGTSYRGESPARRGRGGVVEEDREGSMLLDDEEEGSSPRPRSSSRRRGEGGERMEGVEVEKRPLRGVKVVVIHVKDTLADGPLPEEEILSQLLEYERGLELGCEFVISEKGGCVWV